MVLYGQVVVGPPGTGKTTYCNGMQQYLRLIGRETLVVNLDPANEYQASSTNDDNQHSDDTGNALPYETLFDTCQEFINLSTVMSELNLGPNGGLIYCLEYIHHHIDTFTTKLQSKLAQLQPREPPYLLFDLPGQVELYTHNNTIQNILSHLSQTLDIRLVMVQLIDSHHCLDVHKFISSSLLTMTTMLRLELPAVNVLSKIDLLSTYTTNSNDSDINNQNSHHHDINMPFNLDFFMECQELNRLLPYLLDNDHNLTIEQEEILHHDMEYQNIKQQSIQNNKFIKKYHKLNYELCDIINDYSLINYIPLDINDAESVGRVVARIDKCNGYIFSGTNKRGEGISATTSSNNVSSGGLNQNVEDMFQCALQVDSEWGYEQIADVQERYLNLYQDDVPELQPRPSSQKREGT